MKANTNNQKLSSHSYATGILARHIYTTEFNNDSNSILSKVCFLAGILHDTGKIDKNFQVWLKKQNNGDNYFNENIKHNELSYLIYHLLDINFVNKNKNYNCNILHSIYYHHTIPERRKGRNHLMDVYTNLNKNKFSYLTKEIRILLDDIISLCDESDKSILKFEILNEDVFTIEKIKNKQFERYKDFDNTDLIKSIKINTQNNIIRSCLIKADRLVSKLSSDELEEHIKNKTIETLYIKDVIENNLLNNIESTLIDFDKTSEQSKAQSETAKKLYKKTRPLMSNNIMPVLQGPAGCGKTKIALEWALLSKAKRVIWVCPRTEVCESVFRELTEVYLKDTNVELFTGDKKYLNNYNTITDEDDYLTSDVIITTIDQLSNFIISHDKIDEFFMFLNSYVVFDEFHEIFNIQTHNILFSELVHTKKLLQERSCLLMSATCSPLYMKEILNLEYKDSVKIKSFNTSDYQIEIEEIDEEDSDNILYKNYSNLNKKTIVISNTVVTAQNSYIKNMNTEESLLFHSKFIKEDRIELSKKIYSSFGKNYNNDYNILRSSSLVQSSLNITSDYMISDITSPEELLQRLGRLDRFSQNKFLNKFTIAVSNLFNTKEVLKSKQCSFLIKTKNNYNISKEFLKYIKKKDLSTIKINDLYDMYDDFYSNINPKSVEKEMKTVIDKSIKSIQERIIKPRKMIKKTLSNENTPTISLKALRGDSRYIQLNTYKIVDNELKNLNDYIVKNENQTLTYQLDEIEGNDFYLENTHKIYDGVIDYNSWFERNKKSQKDAILNRYSRIKETPIYLSYTDDDIKNKNIILSDTDKKELKVYLLSNKQPVGMMSLENINKII